MRVLVGIGNRLSTDDGVGSIVAQRMAGVPGWTAIDCGTALENVVGRIGRDEPDAVILVDAARMGLPAGSIRRLPMPSADRMLVSTHGLPLSFALERVTIRVPCVTLVGIEPGDLSLGEGLSPAVSRAADRLVSILLGEELDAVEEWRAGRRDEEP